MNSKTCGSCEAPINLLKSTARFCSTRCRVVAHRAKKKQTIPSELIASDRWVRWKSEPRRGRVSKPPYRVDGSGYASTTNTHTWSPFKDASASAFGDGLGFMLNGDGMAVIDLDDCVVDGVPSAAAQRVLDAYPAAWVEISPSGTGLHVWGTAQAGPGRRFRSSSGLSIEFYTQGRYMTVTGNCYRTGGLSERLDVHALKLL